MPQGFVDYFFQSPNKILMQCIFIFIVFLHENNECLSAKYLRKVITFHLTSMTSCQGICYASSIEVILLESYLITTASYNHEF